jgi:hypothetical protein
LHFAVRWDQYPDPFPSCPEHTLKLTIDDGAETIDENIFPESFMTMTTEPGVISINPPTGTDNNLTDLNMLHQQWTFAEFQT